MVAIRDVNYFLSVNTGEGQHTSLLFISFKISPIKRACPLTELLKINTLKLPMNQCKFYCSFVRLCVLFNAVAQRNRGYYITSLDVALQLGERLVFTIYCYK